MATPIKRIEKDFLLKVLYDEQIPLMLHHGRGIYILHVTQPPKIDLLLKPNVAISDIKSGSKLELIFDYRSQTISFSLAVSVVKDGIIHAEAPEFLYKNLNRAYSRVSSPPGLHIGFCYHGDRYALSFPKTSDFVPIEEPDYSEYFNPTNIKDLVSQLSVWAGETATGYKLVMFKDSKPTLPEEKLVAETGKAIFIPSTQSDIPEQDYEGKARIITRDQFLRYFESNGTDKLFVEDALQRFVSRKLKAGIYSELWAPILFQEYVIGYIRLWIDKVGKPPFDLAVVDTVFQFSKVLAFSLKNNGYFKDARIKSENHEGKVIDVSASGMLFAHPHSPLSESLLPESDLDITMSTDKRTIKTGARIVRRYKDKSQYYFGCRYTDIQPEDLRYLFEFIYGKTLTDSDSSFLVGKV